MSSELYKNWPDNQENYRLS